MGRGRILLRSLLLGLLVGCGGDPEPQPEPHEQVVVRQTPDRKPARDPADARRIRELEARARREGREYRAEEERETRSQRDGGTDEEAPATPSGPRTVPANVRYEELKGFRLQDVDVHEEGGERWVTAKVANRSRKAWREATFRVRFLGRDRATLGQTQLRIEWPPTDGAWRDVRSARTNARGELAQVRIAFSGGSAVDKDEEESVAVPWELEGAGGFRFHDRRVVRGVRQYWRLRCRVATRRHEWALVRFQVEWFDHKGRQVHAGSFTLAGLRKQTERDVEVQGPDYRYRIRKIKIRFDGGE